MGSSDERLVCDTMSCIKPGTVGPWDAGVSLGTGDPWRLRGALGGGALGGQGDWGWGLKELGWGLKVVPRE